MAYAKEQGMIPHEVVSAVIIDGATPTQAWREYLKLTQEEVARRLEISVPIYALQEAAEASEIQFLERVSAALGLTSEQLDF